MATETAELAEAPGEEPGFKEPMSLYSKVSSEKLKRDHYEHFIDAMNRLHSEKFLSTLAISSIQDLKTHGVPEDVIEALIDLSESGIEEYVIVVTFLYHLSQQDRYKKAIDRSLRRIIIKAYKQLPEIKQEIAQKIEGIIVSNNI